MRRRTTINLDEMKKWAKLIVPAGPLLLSICLLAMPLPRFADSSTPDNTANNKFRTPNADQQKMNPVDRAITQNIRKSIHREKGLSTYARNVKIVTQDGHVTLVGPVRSDLERTVLLAKAVAAAGAGNVANQLEVAPFSGNR